MKKNRLVSFIMVLTMVIITSLGNIEGKSTSYAQEKNNLTIKETTSEAPVNTADNKLLLEQSTEKISDTQLKVNLKIKGNEQDVNIKNTSFENKISDNFEISSDNISVNGIKEKENIKGEVTKSKDSISINLGDISSEEVDLSFEAKLKDNAQKRETESLNLKSEIRYKLENSEQEAIEKFPNTKVTLDKGIEKVNPEAIQAEYKSAPQTTQNTERCQGNKNLEINKSAKSNNNGTYNITLEAKGEGSIENSKKADIVLVIDSSGSMNDKINKVKSAAKNLSKNILNGSNDDQVKISVANFYYNSGKYNVRGGSSDLQTDFTSDLNTINQAIKNIPSGGGTHTQDGIWRAQDMLSSNKSRKDAKKYIVFFSDGLPSESYQWGYTGYDIHVKNAQREYYNYFTGYGAPTQVTIGGIGYNPNPNISTAETIQVNNNPRYKDTKFYSVGLFTNASESEKSQAVNFLKTIQNVVDPSEYKDKYYTQDLNSINGIFNDISNEIKENINASVAKESVIHDIVSKEFNIVDKSWKITDLDGNEIQIPPENIVVSKNSKGEDEITFKIGNIIANKKAGNGKLTGGVKVSFDISTKDSYFGGEKIPTNANAEIKYKDPINGSDKEQVFNKPVVDIPYQMGKVTIRKEIVKKDKNGNWTVAKDSDANRNDRFSISILGNSGSQNHKYTVDLNGNMETSMPFYLRGEKTDISSNKDFSMNYFTEGLYGVEEIVPMNYEKVQVWIDEDTSDNGTKWVKFEEYVNDKENIEKNKARDGKLFIGKDNNNINIKVSNTLVNDMFWQDKVYVENKLKYD
ncbi:von Willebrand factor type A domain protein [[Clostridium] bifermentans ATCC 638]|uniref:von Willebrand factor type A domain protein n=1 Tax=Paraclostridium bifermentans ATCC 638 = DSM 14991 TaxID=1233171 RepID=T4VJ02_PARBF|nr:vWA domain-containing protein [Paraclostridium bifermentans]EQK43684.1 von Willebrand factor type A domain protein [[Clostridium] bifermentans ATCC 638] [Paraclostridium bifermentans ATCC 638 = DSM 14991]RIZ59615.1 VWA domain-containing protein [Paraclostridium bifermentans]UAG17522.1 VWA domain-containing protein [Paraclostridium bifermentans]